MAKFSKQHYQAIAQILKDESQEVVKASIVRDGTEQEYDLPSYNAGRRVLTISLAQQLANLFEDDNSRFNREHFLAVVRGERPVNSRPPRS